jgi:hypothetical protein
MNSLNHHSSSLSNITSAAHAPLEIGDDVVLNSGEEGTIACIFRDFAWVFSDSDGFDTYELSELKRQDHQTRSSV